MTTWSTSFGELAAVWSTLWGDLLSGASFVTWEDLDKHNWEDWG